MNSFQRRREKFSRMGKAAQAKAAGLRQEVDPMDLPARPPMVGARLKTVVVIDHVSGSAEQIDLFQGRRRNQYDVMVNSSWRRGLSATRLAAMLRRRWALRWVVE